LSGTPKESGDLLGKRHSYRDDAEPNFEAKASQLGFSFTEILLLKKLYGRQLRGEEANRLFGKRDD